jgi:uncharacterized CHY-type Zn-finger protein
MNFYIPSHIKRLILVFVIFISLFLVLRHFLIPDTFGKNGHYRGAALIDNTQIEIHYSGQQACFECHQDIEDLKLKDLHSQIHCETCHGPGQKHVLSKVPADILKPNGREFCGSCHNINTAKQKDAVLQVNLKEHNIEKNCIDCHNPHQPWEMKK